MTLIIEVAFKLLYTNFVLNLIKILSKIKNEWIMSVNKSLSEVTLNYSSVK
jgi:hypothetical protein